MARQRAPMNYRHAYHAGNFADVVKHAVLCRVLVHLREKPAAFRVIDTHAGAGATISPGRRPARRRNGATASAGCMRRRARRRRSRALLAPYLDAVAALNPDGRLATYPGSPALAQALLRPQDRLIACELEPQAAAALEHALARRRARQGDRDRRLDRAHRLRAAEGAARRGADRSAVRAAGRIRPPGAGACGGAPQMADRHLPALVPDQGRGRGRRRSPAGSPGSASRRCCAWN